MDEPPKLVMVPSPHNFSEAAFQQLLAYVENGGTLLFTGPIRIDDNWRTASRLQQEMGSTTLENVLREEALSIDGQTYCLAFGDRKIARLSKEVPSDGAVGLKELKLGKGKLLWCPLPVELNDRAEPIKQLYSYALEVAEVKREMDWIKGGEFPGVYGRKLAFNNGALFIFVSEFGQDAEIEVRDPKTGKSYSFMLAKERSVLFATNSAGQVIAVYRPQEVSIHIH